MRNFRFTFIITLFPLASFVEQVRPPEPNAAILVQWNLITVNATKRAGFNSNLGSRIEAIEAIAVYDAVNSIKHIRSPYQYNRKADDHASIEAAAGRELLMMCSRPVSPAQKGISAQRTCQ